MWRCSHNYTPRTDWRAGFEERCGLTVTVYGLLDTKSLIHIQRVTETQVKFSDQPTGDSSWIPPHILYTVCPLSFEVGNRCVAPWGDGTLSRPISYVGILVLVWIWGRVDLMCFQSTLFRWVMSMTGQSESWCSTGMIVADFRWVGAMACDSSLKSSGNPQTSAGDAAPGSVWQNSDALMLMVTFFNTGHDVAEY